LEYLSERIGSTLRESASKARTIGCASAYGIIFPRIRRCESANRRTTSANCSPRRRICSTNHFTRRVAVRLVGVSVTNLETDRRQNELFDTNANRRWYLNRGLDSVRGVTAGTPSFYGQRLELREHYATKPNGLVLSTPCFVAVTC